MKLVVSLLAVALAAPALAQTPPARLPLDGVLTLNGVEFGCTGIRQSKLDPRWKAFPMRVEFAAPNGDYLSDEALSVSDAAGKMLASVTCEGPWILIKPQAPGEYHFTGWVSGKPGAGQGGVFRVPAKGQTLAVLHFAAP